MSLRELPAAASTDAVEALCIEANTRLPADVKAALDAAEAAEPWPLAKETLDDAIDNANEAARTWITVELEEDEPILPHVSDPEDILLAEDELIRNISVNIRFYEGWDE